MRRLVYFGLGFVAWIVYTWPFADGKIDIQVLVAGLIASAVVAVLFNEILPKEHHVFVSPVRIFWFLVYLPVLDSGITALANSITLTPGTLTVDVGEEGVLYVHWINVRVTDIEETTKLIGERFEWFLKKVFE
jgi:multicomponent Na+:H+ antiporter subunit E